MLVGAAGLSSLVAGCLGGEGYDPSPPGTSVGSVVAGDTTTGAGNTTTGAGNTTTTTAGDTSSGTAGDTTTGAGNTTTAAGDTSSDTTGDNATATGDTSSDTTGMGASDDGAAPNGAGGAATGGSDDAVVGQGGASAGGATAQAAGGAQGDDGYEGDGGASGGAVGMEPTVPTYMCDDERTACEGGQADGKECSGINQLAYIDAQTLGGGDGNDIWGWTDPETDKEYAIVCLSNGTAFVDVSDPCRPVHLGNLTTATATALWRDAKVYKNYAYIVSEASGHGVQVFDLTKLRNVANPPVTFQADNVVGDYSAHNIVINPESGFAYAVGASGCGPGRVLDLNADPANPQDLGCLPGPYCHDSMCFNYKGPDEAFAGAEICVGGSGRDMYVLDVTDKNNMQVVSTGNTYPNLGYAHQVWFTEDHKYALVTDESDEINSGISMVIHVFDMSNLASPQLHFSYDAGLTNSDHNGYVRGDYYFLAAYAGGHRVLDISNIAEGEITEAGFFDTYPRHNNASYSGDWGAYAFFKSGIVITNSIEMGMHVLEVDPTWIQDSRYIGW